MGGSIPFWESVIQTKGLWGFFCLELSSVYFSHKCRVRGQFPNVLQLYCSLDLIGLASMLRVVYLFSSFSYSVAQNDRKIGPLKLTRPDSIYEPCETVIGGMIVTLSDFIVT